MKTRSYLPLRSFWGNTPFRYLVPFPQQILLSEGEKIDLTKRKIILHRPLELAEIAAGFSKDLRELGLNCKTSLTYSIELRIDELKLSPEGYRLQIDETGCSITGQSLAGVFYGIQTFLQLIGFEHGIVPCLKIKDWPSYAIRSVMIDMGRGVYTEAMIKRVIRIMARLKLNTLHLHLYDDQLMGIRFKRLPLGSENPQALPIAKIGEIVQYARQYHISVCPEMESWGHVGSILHHYPKLFGAPGMYEGSSFGIGRDTFEVLRKIYEEVIPFLETESLVHLGLDEARWALLPDMKNRKNVNPTWLVGKLHHLVTRIGRDYGRKLRVRIWADHGGRPTPKYLQNKVIVEPWSYWESAHRRIKASLERYSGADKTPFIMGAGQSSVHFAGAFGATRVWSKGGQDAPNCLGVNLCLWEGNFVERYLLTIYGGAQYAWNARKSIQPHKDPYRESIYGMVYCRMLSWQTLFQDANEASILKDRGPGVYRGYYTNGPKAGLPVAPTAILLKPRTGDMKG